jgi:hypothetical protein
VAGAGWRGRGRPGAGCGGGLRRPVVLRAGHTGRRGRVVGVDTAIRGSYVRGGRGEAEHSGRWIFFGSLRRERSGAGRRVRRADFRCIGAVAGADGLDRPDPRRVVGAAVPGRSSAAARVRGTGRGGGTGRAGSTTRPRRGARRERGAVADDGSVGRRRCGCGRDRGGRGARPAGYRRRVLRGGGRRVVVSRLRVDCCAGHRAAGDGGVGAGRGGGQGGRRCAGNVVQRRGLGGGPLFRAGCGAS